MAELLLQWFARYPEPRLEGVNTPMMGKAHFCESEIADRKITYCGLELEPEDGTVLSAVPTPDVNDRCETCSGGHPST